MNVVGRVGSFISQGVSSVATPFHPFGGAVDIIVVKQHDGTYRSTPWYVRFGKFQGVLKGAEKLVRIEVNGVKANFNMHLDNSGEAYFSREINDGLETQLGNLENADDSPSGHSSKENDDLSQYAGECNDEEVEVRDERGTLGMNRLERLESDCDRIFYEFPDENSSLEGSPKFSEHDSSTHNNSDNEHVLKSQNSYSDEVILVSVDGHMLTAPMSPSEGRAENLEPSTPQFHLHSGKETDDCSSGHDATGCEVSTGNASVGNDESLSSAHNLESCGGDGEVPCNSFGKNISADHAKKLLSFQSHEVFKSCLELQNLSLLSPTDDPGNGGSSMKKPEDTEISRDNDELISYDSGIPTSISSAQGEVAGHERNASDVDRDCSDGMPAQFVSNNHKSLEQEEVDQVIERMHTGEQSSFDKQCQNNCHGPNDELEISLCGNLLHAGMGLRAAQAAFDAKRISVEEFKHSASSIVKNENLIVRLDGQYIPWNKAEHIIFGTTACGLDLSIAPQVGIPVEQETLKSKEDDSAPSHRWGIWPIPFWRAKTLEQSRNNSSMEGPADSDFGSTSQFTATNPTTPASVTSSPRKQILRTNVPTSDQIESLNLKDGQNMVTFVFSSKVLGSQKVDAHIYLWKWNSRIVISDVDGTITKSDVLGQFMPLVGKDWTHSGIIHLFCAIEENGYQLLFLSARAIVQAYLTKNFLCNLKQDGKSLPTGPVVISPDGLFPSLYREVIRRAPHEFKIACLEDIKALFPPDYNPFYAGFGNRDTDELSYLRIGIPKGKIFIINPKGEVAINHQIDVKSYTSLHTLVDDIFPPTSVEQEDYNSWNFWKMPLPDME